MPLELTVRVSPDRLRFESPGVGLHADIPNRVTVTLPDRKLVSIERSPQELEKADPGWWAKNKSAVGTQPAFDVESFDPEIALRVLELQGVRVRYRGRSLLSALLLYSCEPFVLNVWFPAYEEVATDLRAAFEYRVQDSLNLSAFSINGQSVGWRRWQRNLAKWTRSFLRLLIVPVSTIAWLSGSFIGMYYGMGSILPDIPFWMWAVLLLVWSVVTALIVQPFSWFLADTTWAVAMRMLLPTYLLRMVLINSRADYPHRMQRWLINNLLPSPHLRESTNSL